MSERSLNPRAKSSRDLFERPSAPLNPGVRASRLKGSLPVTGGLGIRMHVGEKDSCAWTGNAINLLCKGLEVVKVADDERRQHHVGSAVANRQGSAAPEAKIAGVVSLIAARSSIAGEMSTPEQASRRASGQLVQPPACTAAGIEDIQAANIRQHGTEDTLFQRKQRIRLGVIDFRPGIKHLRRERMRVGS
jgi:hypothetical protein